ncbi:MAG: MFS transporter [Pseudomonadota bacterium]
MNRLEKRSALSLALVFGFRMLGLFMLMPIMMIDGQELTGATPALLGLAIGIYGLSQALLQIPMGYLSDKWGRKPVIYAGLLLFFIGSVVAALSTSVYGVILGRVLQGAGAIASTVMALATDLTRDQNRSKVLAMIGVSIGLAFVLAISIGPLLSHLLGIQGIFVITAVCALLAMLVVKFLVPTPERRLEDTTAKIQGVWQAMHDAQLTRLNISVFVLHFSLTAIFVAIPLYFQAQGISQTMQSFIYASSLVVGFFAMLPIIVWTERNFKHHLVVQGAVVVFMIAFGLMMIMHHVFVFFVAAVFLYFFAFNFLEATLPSLVSRIVDPKFKGSALGAYSTSQFFGAFLGSTCAGMIVSTHSEIGIYWMALLISALWLIAAMGIQSPPKLLNLTLHIHTKQEDNWEEIAALLSSMKGIKESVVVPEENIVYIKAKTEEVSEKELQNLPFVNSIS